MEKSQVFDPASFGGFFEKPPKFLSLKLKYFYLFFFFFFFTKYKYRSYLLSYCSTAEWGSLEMSAQQQQARPGSSAIHGLEVGPWVTCLVLRLATSKALQTHSAGCLYFLALSISSPKQFAKSNLTIFILRSVIFKNENINFCLKKKKSWKTIQKQSQ